MSKNSASFAFRQFELMQSNDAWKVGTDSVLLGSWCGLEGAQRVLDMGTGSGILSLMLAQRDDEIRIDAIEISDEAAEAARINFKQSKWADRITLIHEDLMNPRALDHCIYNLIICNPPYYPSGLTSPDEARKSARQGRGFSLMELPQLARMYLKEGGRLNVVIPAQIVYHFIERANTHGLYVHKKLTIRHSYSAPDSLVLLEMRDHIVMPEHQTLILYNDQNPSPEYRHLCESFIFI